MSPIEMLRVLDEHGGDAGSDYNDGENVTGYFGWRVEGVDTPHPVLIVWHEPDDGERVERAFEMRGGEVA